MKHIKLLKEFSMVGKGINLKEFIKDRPNFEKRNKDKKYRIGDYLLVVLSKLDQPTTAPIESDTSVEVEVVNIKNFHGTIWYVCNSLDMDDFLINNDNIIRKLTDEEIEDFKINLNAKKFGL